MSELLQKVKDNLIITFNDDDNLIQHLDEGYYESHDMNKRTEQAVIMLASHFYESRDGSTGGFFADNTNANEQVYKTVNRLLLLDREWKVQLWDQDL